MKKAMTISLTAIVLMGMCLISVLIGAEEKKPARPLRVGVYDSRCITIAYANSAYSKNEIQKIFDVVHKAEKEGDIKTAQSTREIAEYMQKKRHLQGFGTGPVQELLEPIQDKLPQVAQQTGVDIIVSKWQIDYQVKDAEYVDVTDALVKLYNPNERGMKSVEGIKKVSPVSEEEILKIKD